MNISLEEMFTEIGKLHMQILAYQKQQQAQASLQKSHEPEKFKESTRGNFNE